MDHHWTHTHTTWRHLFLLPYCVIPGELDPLVRLDTCHAEKLHTLHAVPRCLGVVVAADTQLVKTKVKNKWKEVPRDRCHNNCFGNNGLRRGRLGGPTWLLFSTVLLGTSTESLTKKLSSMSISQHSCLHTGHRTAPTGSGETRSTIRDVSSQPLLRL